MNEKLQKWVNAIKSGDPKQVTDLYHVDGILLGTFSNKERVGHELILEYFENLLKSPVEVEIVSENFLPGYDQQYPSATIRGTSGLYNFVTGGKTINARFSFVYYGQLYERPLVEWKIVSHHSSVIPKT